MEATCLLWYVGLRLSYLVLPLYLASRHAGQAQSAKLLINTLFCITDGAEPLTIYIAGVSISLHLHRMVSLGL